MCATQPMLNKHTQITHVCLLRRTPQKEGNPAWHSRSRTWRNGEPSWTPLQRGLTSKLSRKRNTLSRSQPLMCSRHGDMVHRPIPKKTLAVLRGLASPSKRRPSAPPQEAPQQLQGHP
ncbi:hypothetical protein L596_001895 [Steinernema carpocapsae]|uniref:Uncharacterized protein n=1 Tax=Steinernema carpocapsae TaxID=34508 RepID=A0A4U8UQ96_STECR|nr:hypothetical protein L596_001895 [Steinernema carpocapsae]